MYLRVTVAYHCATSVVVCIVTRETVGVQSIPFQSACIQWAVKKIQALPAVVGSATVAPKSHFHTAKKSLDYTATKPDRRAGTTASSLDTLAMEYRMDIMVCSVGRVRLSRSFHIQKPCAALSMFS